MMRTQFVYQLLASLIFFPIGVYVWFLNNKDNAKHIVLPLLLVICVVVNAISFNNILMKPAKINFVYSILWGNGLTFLFFVLMGTAEKLSLVERIVKHCFFFSLTLFLVYSMIKLGLYLYKTLTNDLYMFIISFLGYIVSWVLFSVSHRPKQRKMS